MRSIDFYGFDQGWAARRSYEIHKRDGSCPPLLELWCSPRDDTNAGAGGMSLDEPMQCRQRVGGWRLPISADVIHFDECH